MTLQRKIAPHNSRNVCPGTVSKSSAPCSMIQFDILIKVTTKESQRGNERKSFIFQAGKENLFVDLHADERDLRAQT